MLDSVPRQLRELEFACIHFELEFQESTRLPATAFLRLRREMLQAVRFAEAAGDGEEWRAILEPPLPSDPVVRKRVQKPGPGFVIRGVPVQARQFEIGDSFELTVHFWGRASQQLEGFANILKMLGRNGLSHGEGLFEIASIEAEDAIGQRSLLAGPGEELAEPALPLIDVPWLLDSYDSASAVALELRFVTPARLLSRGRPLFRPCFADIFPFILRRITSISQAHCDCEALNEAAALIESAGRVDETQNALQWADWRRLEGPGLSQDIGGVSGSIRIEGPQLGEIAWVLLLGSLMQIGKGAAYGAGRYELVFPS